MGREFELKFRATRSQQAAIQAKYGDFATIEMETTYYDTPDGSLAARKITLRRRLENGKSVCTVKTPGSSGGRGEWETECGDIEAAIPILCQLGCPEDLVSLTKKGLTAVCGARFTRRAKTITVRGDTLELALDSGVLTGGGREVPICEVEVEAKASKTSTGLTHAEGTVMLWGTMFGEEFGLQPELKSKFRRALDLAKGE